MRSLLMLLLVPVMPGTFYDSLSPVLAYSGVWTTVDNVNAVGESVESTSAGTVTFETASTGFSLLYFYSPGGADIEVAVQSPPGAASTVVATLSSDGIDSSARAEVVSLEDGPKRITLSATSGTFLFDGLYIYPADEIEVDQRVTDEFEIEGEMYSGSYYLTFTAGEVVISLLLVALTSVQLANMVLWVWYRQ